MDDDYDFDVELAIAEINANVGELFGSLDDMACDWKALEAEVLDWMDDGEEIELVFN